jgi:hypothetical protein
MASVADHVHISGITALINALYVIAVFGVIHLVARRFEGHPFADAWLDIWA